MATASLLNYTVPLAGTQNAGSQGLLMPKLAWRFRVTFIGFGVSQPTTELTKQVMDITRPTVQFGDIVVDVYNSKVKLLGKPEWQDITVNLRDDASGAASKLIGEQLQKQFDFAEQASAASGIDYKFTLQIEMLDGGNGAENGGAGAQPIEIWQCYGCYLSQVNYGEVNYASGTEVVKIALTVKYDNAEQIPVATQSSGVGFGATLQALGATSTG